VKPSGVGRTWVSPANVGGSVGSVVTVPWGTAPPSPALRRRPRGRSPSSLVTTTDVPSCLLGVRSLHSLGVPPVIGGRATLGFRPILKYWTGFAACRVPHARFFILLFLFSTPLFYHNSGSHF